MAAGNPDRLVRGCITTAALHDRYACDGCGAVFSPHHGPQNIYATPQAPVDAVRDGECIVCETDRPTMSEVVRDE